MCKVQERHAGREGCQAKCGRCVKVCKEKRLRLEKQRSDDQSVKTRGLWGGWGERREESDVFLAREGALVVGWGPSAGVAMPRVTDKGQVWELREQSSEDFLELTSGVPRLKAGREVGSERFEG